MALSGPEIEILDTIEIIIKVLIADSKSNGGRGLSYDRVRKGVYGRRHHDGRRVVEELRGRGDISTSVSPPASSTVPLASRLAV